jgi:hypothetical protein
VPGLGPAFAASLRRLDIRSNRLAALPPLVLQCKGLAALLCSSNALAGCPEAAQLTKHLPELRLLVVGGSSHDTRAVRQLLALSQYTAAIGHPLEVQLSG